MTVPSDTIGKHPNELSVQESMPSHPIQWHLLNLAERKDLSQFTLRGLAKELGQKIYPQQMKHHLTQLEKRGLIRFYIDAKTYERRFFLDRQRLREVRQRLHEQQPPFSRR